VEERCVFCGEWTCWPFPPALVTDERGESVCYECGAQYAPELIPALDAGIAQFAMTFDLLDARWKASTLFDR